MPSNINSPSRYHWERHLAVIHTVDYDNQVSSLWILRFTDWNYLRQGRLLCVCNHQAMFVRFFEILRKRSWRHSNILKTRTVVEARTQRVRSEYIPAFCVYRFLVIAFSAIKKSMQGDENRRCMRRWTGALDIRVHIQPVHKNFLCCICVDTSNRRSTLQKMQPFMNYNH